MNTPWVYEEYKIFIYPKEEDNLMTNYTWSIHTARTSIYLLTTNAEFVYTAPVYSGLKMILLTS